jgi:hypothetical protein
MEFYKTFGFKIIILSYALLSIVTSYLCYEISKKNKNSLILLWVVLGYLFPIFPYLFLKWKYKK